MFSSASTSERGAIVVLAAIGLLMILLLIGIATVNFGLADRGLVELQLAADNAAASAASRLCSSKDCYERARKAAIEMVSSHSSISSIGTGNSLNIKDISIPDNEYTWTDSARNLTVTIERGVWRNHAFESYEGDWQAQHPGIPAFIASNAVRVTIARPQTSFFRSAMSGGDYSLGATAVGVKGATEPTLVAPFALPVCALINNQGDYYGGINPTELCKADRYFTRADRFETISGSAEGANRGPAFAYEPCNPEVQNSSYTYKWPRWPDGVIVDFPLVGAGNWGFTYFPNLSGLNKYLNDNFSIAPISSTQDGSSCALVHGAWFSGFGGRPYFPQPNPHNGKNQEADYYGVIGIPGDYRGQNVEEMIQEGLNDSNNPAWPASLGDSYTILPEGLTSRASDALVWNAIINGDHNGAAGAAESSAHPALGSTPIGTFSREKVIYSSRLAAVDINVDEPDVCAAGYECSSYPYAAPNNPALLRDGVEWFAGGASKFDGLCNSKWVKLQNYRINTGVGYWADEFEMKADAISNPNLSDETPVWKTKIPVIANQDAGASECYGINPAVTQDPVIDESANYIVIGFVEGFVFDDDIGYPQPDVTFTYPGGYQHKLKGFGFMKDVPGANSCNTIHGRLDCKRWFVPDSNLESEPQTTLIQ